MWWWLRNRAEEEEEGEEEEEKQLSNAKGAKEGERSAANHTHFEKSRLGPRGTIYNVWL